MRTKNPALTIPTQHDELEAKGKGVFRGGESVLPALSQPTRLPLSSMQVAQTVT
jgi:hypothetical protein